MPLEPFEIIYPPWLKSHFRVFESRIQHEIRDAIEEQLRYTPLVTTRNRKPLHQPIQSAEWELRCGPDNSIRVLYKCDLEMRQVILVAVGEKRNNQLWIQGEQVLS